jgi:hypothetical protein
MPLSESPRHAIDPLDAVPLQPVHEDIRHPLGHGVSLPAYVVCSRPRSWPPSAKTYQCQTTAEGSRTELQNAGDDDACGGLLAHRQEVAGLVRIVGSRTGAVPRRLPLAVSAVSSFVPV